jgi:Family of unknown function (DUF6507)
MSTWRISPADVQSVLIDVQTSAEELSEQLTEAKFQSVLDGLTWGAAVTGDVPAAINALIGDQVKNLTNISNRIQAGTMGVANAVVSYNNGQIDMAGTYQTQAFAAAESGDFTYFVKHNQLGSR